MGFGPGTAGDIGLNFALSAELQQKYADPALIRRLLSETKTIAVVGLSPNPQRPSHFVASYMQYEGYRIVPVNPRAGELLGEKSWPDVQSIDLDAIGAPIDMVNIFRRPEECPEIARQAVAIGAASLWMQLRVISLEAATIAEEAGLDVVIDRCIKMEHGRYNGSLHWVGMNTQIISAKKGR